MRLLLVLLLAGCPTAKAPGDSADPADTARFACGDTLTCAATEVCVADQYPATCTDRTDTGAPCPDGTTATQCGGAGLPCCCEPTPAPVYRCHDASACGDPPTCDCLVDVCPASLACTSRASETGRAFLCEEPSKP